MRSFIQNVSIHAVAMFNPTSFGMNQSPEMSRRDRRSETIWFIIWRASFHLHPSKIHTLKNRLKRIERIRKKSAKSCMFRSNKSNLPHSCHQVFAGNAKFSSVKERKFPKLLSLSTSLDMRIFAPPPYSDSPAREISANRLWSLDQSSDDVNLRPAL